MEFFFCSFYLRVFRIPYDGKDKKPSDSEIDLKLSSHNIFKESLSFFIPVFGNNVN
jgi:hypothetical protein